MSNEYASNKPNFDNITIENDYKAKKMVPSLNEFSDIQY